MSARKVKQYRFITNKTRPYASQQPQAHIVEQKLNRKEELIDKYQNQIDNLMNHINMKEQGQTINPRALLNKRERVRSSTRDEQLNYSALVENPISDYKKIILGLEYSLENEKKLASELERKNKSLESEVSNLRNLLVKAPEKQGSQSSYDNGLRAYKDRVAQLEQQLSELRAKATTVADAKTEAINYLEKQNRALRSEFDSQNDKGLMKKVSQLVNLNEELRSAIYRKNLKIQKLSYGTDDNPDDRSVSSGDSQKQDLKTKREVSFLMKKIETMSKQFDIANQLILRKNTELLMVAKSKRTNEQVIALIDSLLDKKQITSNELLAHPVVNKVRIFMRQRVLFEKQLFQKLTFHNKKIQILEDELKNKEGRLEDHSSAMEQQCKQLNKSVTNLQKQLMAYEKELNDKKNEVEIVRNDYAIQKKNFVFKMREMSQQLNGIIATTQQEFQKQKLENLKLAQQNRSLLFLIGSKQKQLTQKGAAIRTFEKYKETINNLPINVESSPSRAETKLRSEASYAQIPEDAPKPARLLLITTFSNWLIEWNKIRNWPNRKTLLNILLDKQQLRNDGYDNSLNSLISVIHESFFNSKNVDIQERTAVLVSMFLNRKLILNKNFYVPRVAPYIIRCFRQKYEGEDPEQHRLYNEAALSFTDALDQENIEWNYEMTNQMVAVNGFKYVFGVINNDGNDDLIDKAYNTLAVISKKNEMINFMVSYNISDLILKNMDSKYRFISHVLYLLQTLLDSQEYVRASTKYLSQFRSIFNILLDDDTEVLQSALKCSLKLCKQSVFIRGVNRKEVFPKIITLLGKVDHFEVLKLAGKLFIALLQQTEPSEHERIARKELLSILDIIKGNELINHRFSRANRLLLKCLRIINNADLDVSCFFELIKYMDDNFDRIDEKTRKKMIEIINLVNQRNRGFYEKNLSSEILGDLVKGYLSMKPNYIVQTIFFLNMMRNGHELKKTVDILKIGRQSLINKLIDDSQQVDYTTSISSLKNLLAISKDKYSQKFITPQNCIKILKYAIRDKTEEEYASLCLSILYFLSKFQSYSATLVENDVVPKMCNLLVEKYEFESITFKILAVLETNNVNHFKKKILNYIIGGDKKLTFLKTLNYVLRRSKNKVQLGSRALFVYDFLNNQSQMESLALVIENNDWMVQDLVKVRNDYVGVLEPIVYKIQLLLHEMSKVSKVVKKQYQRFIVQHDQQDQD